MRREQLAIFSPLPPERNGIADYSFHLLTALREVFDCAAFVADPHAEVPSGVTVHDHLQAFRTLGPGSRILHQIGNNPGHVFVLQALRAWGGVTTLHDQNLHYLYEVSGARPAELRRRMAATSPALAATFARHWQDSDVKTPANYALFDMLDEVLSASDTVIVHSEFARRRLRILHGRQQATDVAVIPHLALPFTAEPAEALRRLNIPKGAPLILTAGFATFAKRFDWLVEALDDIARRNIGFTWVHAGQERAEEYNLSALIDRHPRVKARCHVTGYLDENDLNAYIYACDILVNLRYPSVGESSGTLARAMSGGKCCVVSNTAAYADLPGDAVLHVPVTEPVPALADALAGLLGQFERRAEIGEAARRFVAREWAPAKVASAYAEVLNRTRRKPALKQPAQKFAARPVHIALSPGLTASDVARQIDPDATQLEIVFESAGIAELAALSLRLPKLLSRLLPAGFAVRSCSIEPAGGGDARTGGPVAVRVKGSIA